MFLGNEDIYSYTEYNLKSKQFIRIYKVKLG